MEPRAFTDAEKLTIYFFFYVKEMHDNYVVVTYNEKDYIIAPIGDTFEYSCSSEGASFTEPSFSRIMEHLDAR